MRRKLLGTCGLLMICAAAGQAQTSIAELDATQSGMNSLNSGPVAPAGGAVALDRARQLQATPPGPVTGQVAPAGAPPQTAAPGAAPGVTTGAGFSPAPVAAIPVPAGAPGAPAAPAFDPALAAQGGIPGQPGQPGQPVQATPTPEPTIKVLIGKRVYDAVTGALLEDAIQRAVLQSEQDKYADDGVHDNGIQGDGIRGNVTTIKDKYIGAETNALKNRLINLVRNAENLSPMTFYGFHVMAVDPTTQHRQMPNLLEKEAQRDESLRDWNNKFLADYRVVKNDPRSEFYQLYVPDPPMPPPYPVPPGYTAPQKLAPGQTGAPGVGATPAVGGAGSTGEVAI